MKYLVFFIAIVLTACSTKVPSDKPLQIIPKPNTVQVYEDYHKTDGKLNISFADGHQAELIKVFKSQLPVEFLISDNAASKVSISSSEQLDEHTYELSITPKEISIKANNRQSRFNALQSLVQLITFASKDGQNYLLPCCEIKDAPRFAWRGIMLDESRHFFGPEKVKQLIDMMAFYKLNVFHWHLTDEPGWRLEIKQYPKLSKVGGKGNYSQADAPAAYYTQAQIKEIVDYAAQRFIEVIPEIDMPGHAAAANRAYPEYSGGGSAKYPEWTFNPGKEETFSYLTNILKESTTLFPSKYIHIGGDEVHFGNDEWNHKPEIQALMKKHNFKDLQEVERFFVNRMSDTITSLNKITMGWDEIVDAGVEANKAVAMWWRHDKTNTLQHALDNQFKVILCPRIPLYFDFDQDTTHRWGRRWDGDLVELKSVYNYPTDETLNAAHTPNQIMGIQANIWTERIQNNKRLDFMTYPRLQAMAEAAWTTNQQKNYDDFSERLKKHLPIMNDKDIYYFNVFDPTSTPEPDGVLQRKRN